MNLIFKITFEVIMIFKSTPIMNFKIKINWKQSYFENHF